MRNPIFNSKATNWCEIFLCMVWGGKLMSYITAVFLRIPSINLIATWVVPILYVVVFLCAFKEFSKRVLRGSLSFYLICATTFLLTYFFFPLNAEYLDEDIGRFLLTVLPFVFVGNAINIIRLSKAFYVISLLCIYLEALNVLVFEVRERSVEEYQYDMAAAYYLLPHVLMVVWHLLKKINIIDILASLVGLFILIGYGTRGAILCVGVFVGLYLLFGRERRRKFWTYFIIVTAIVASVVFLNRIVEIVDIGIGEVGLSSRITNAYVEKELSDDSGRGGIRRCVVNALNESDIFGMGLCGDRVATGGLYSHSVILETWASFGYLFGSILLLTLVWFVFRAWRACKTFEEKGFLILLIAEASHLFVSNSFIRSSHFFLLIGYCAKLIYNSLAVRNNHHFCKSPKTDTVLIATIP